MTVTTRDLLHPITDLPDDLAKLRDARGRAWAAYVEFEAANHDALADDWQTRAEAADIKNAVDAIASGEEPPSSVVDSVRAARPMTIAKIRKLESDVVAAETAFRRAYSAAAADMEAAARERLNSAAADAEAAWNAFEVARDAASRAGVDIRHLRDWQSGRCHSRGSRSPLQTDRGITPDESLSPVAQIREVVESFEEPFVPVKRVRVSLPNGRTHVLAEAEAESFLKHTPGTALLGPVE